MVIKGSARAEAGKLAVHLLRMDTNERVDVLEMSGVCAPDLTAALLQMEAVASAARSRRPFYHASINTAPGELLTDAQKSRTIDRLEQELGLTGQPRVVVEHVKEGREHLHVAWSRIDGETLCAIPDSHNYRKHEIVARELEREFEHARVQGAHHERDGVERPVRCPSHAETRQAERSGITPEDAKAQLRELWQAADSGQAFAAALDNAGWTLAQGDKRGFVALDATGEVRAVNKAITGLSAAQVRERLADLDAEQLPTVDQARERLRNQQQQPEPAPAPEIDHETDELARLEAMAQDFDSRDYDDQAASELEPVQDDFGHGQDDGSDLAHEREAEAEARARDDMAAFDAERDALRREIDEHNASVAELDAIREDVREQFRQQREALNAAELEAARNEKLASATQQRGDDSALNAAQAMEDLARIDPIGTARHFGHHIGDRLKSPEEMRREWADLMRGGISAGPGRDPAPEAPREAEPDQVRERTREPEQPAQAQAQEKERGGLFQKLRDFVRGLFETNPQPEPQQRQPQPPRDRAADRDHDQAAGDRQAEKVKAAPAQQPAQEQAPQAQAQPQRQTERPRPAERVLSVAEEIMQEAKALHDRELAALRARETPKERADREQRDRAAEADLSRGRGDGSRERTRYHHSLLWELLHPFHDHTRRDHHQPRRPEP